MIRDRGQFEFFAFAPVVSTFLSPGTFGWDLNADYGQGQSPRKAPLIGQGEEFLFHLRVTTQFVIGSGTPVLQIHAALSNTGAPGASFMETGADLLFIGEVAPSIHTAGGRTHSGLVAAQLTLGTDYFMRVNPWTAAMGRNAAGSTVIGKDLRYLGIVLSNPRYDLGDFFSAGQIFGKLIKSSANEMNPTDFLYPPGTVMVG